MNLQTVLLLSIAVFVVDLAWLTLTGPSFMSMVRSIQGSPSTPRIVPALVVYLALGYLATIPTSYQSAFLLGLCVYAVYDFTNLALFKRYDWRMAVADSLWGGVLLTLVFAIRKRFF
jgi:hypothetical protein